MYKTVGWCFLGAAFLMFATFAAPAQGPTPEPAQTVIDAAVAKAKAENKAVFVHFSASW